MSKPIFFDPSGRRSMWSRRVVAVLIAAIVLAAIAFATTLWSRPAPTACRCPSPAATANRSNRALTGCIATATGCRSGRRRHRDRR